METTKVVPKLLILRGPSRQDNIAFAKAKFSTWKVVSTDDYFTDKDGVVRFDANKIKDSYEYCIDEVIRLLKEGHNVVLANNNRDLWHFKIYTLIPNLDYEVRVFRMMTHFYNTDSVRPEVINSFNRNYEAFKGAKLPNGFIVKAECQVKLAPDGSLLYRR